MGDVKFWFLVLILIFFFLYLVSVVNISIPNVQWRVKEAKKKKMRTNLQMHKD